MTGENSRLFQSVRDHALRTLSFEQRQETNLYLEERIYEQGETIGPPRQEIVATRRSILVFADDRPLASFAHPCRYLLYDARSAEFHRQESVQFPPFVKATPATLKAFHEPVRFMEKPIEYPIRPRLCCPIILPKGERYAIFFSGMSRKQPLNDMEFLYRTLLDVYSFNPKNIYVLHYDGTLASADGAPTTWPGDGTNYRIQVNGEGTRAAFEAVIDELKSRLKRDDLLFIHTNQCGSHGASPGTSDLNTYPNWDPYYANDFAAKIGELPRYSSLLVMMSQCHSGGFNAPILAKSTAAATSVASAATEPNFAFCSADGNWDQFARDWIAAQAGNDPFGGALAFNPDSNGNGKIEAVEAFLYASSIKNPNDTPNFSKSSAAGGDIALGQEYYVWRRWCGILQGILEEHHLRLPPREYDEALRNTLPGLTEILSSVDKSSEKLHQEFSAKVEAVIDSAFARRRKRR